MSTRVSRATLSHRAARAFSLVRKAVEVCIYEGPGALAWRELLWLRKHWYYRRQRPAARTLLDTAARSNGANTASPSALDRANGSAPGLRPVSHADRFRVLFVAPIEEVSSKRYRVDNLRAQLALAGIDGDAIWDIDLARLLDHALTFDVIVFHRIPATPELRSFAAAARGRSIPLVFEIDDYLFDAGVLPSLPGLEEASSDVASRVRSQVAGLAETLQLCDAFVGSTHFLAQRAEEPGRRTFVVRNGLSDHHLALAQTALAGRARVRRQPSVRIGYMSGTRTHRQDFAVAAPALLRILGEFPHVTLVLRGLLDVPDVLLPYARRIELRPYISWQRLVAATAALDIAIAPLALDNPFTEGKSALKYFESAIVRVPVVASPSEEFRLAIRHGDNGLLASSDEEWYECLRSLVSDDALRSRMGSSARADALARYTIDAQSPGTVQVFRDLSAHAPVLSRHVNAAG